MSGAWGSGGWGSGAWGGGAGLEDIAFVDAVPIRENVVRVEFSSAVFLTGLLEEADASRTDKWQMLAVADSVGAAGDAARAVRVARVELSTEADDVEEVDLGRFVNVVLDRPMTPFPAQYDLLWDAVFSAGLSDSTTGEARLYSTYRMLAPPQVEAGRPPRDFSNPQVLEQARAALKDPADPYALGTYGVGDDGDYAFDEGTSSLKKRVIRRLVTRKGAFAHLPNYGVGIPDEAKRLGVAAVLSRLAGEAEAQIREEPDVAQVKVTYFLDPKLPGLVFFRVLVRPRLGNVVRFDVPFQQAA